jgi:multidrug efflux system outer membrane protein
MSKAILGLLLGATALPLAACELAPTYQAPSVATPPAFKEAAGWTLAAPADAQTRADWWVMFKSPELDGLEARLTAANQDLQIARARFDEARALARQAQSQLFPTLSAGAGISEHKTSRDVGNPAPRSRYSDDLLQLDLNYELDVWGRLRDEARAGQDRAQASAADLATVNLSLQAELATDYFSLRGADLQQAILNQTVASYAKALDLTQARFNGGYSSGQDVSAAKALLELAKTQASDLQLNRARLEHAIAILIGEPPATFSLPVQPLIATAPVVTAVLPGTLLQRRPDIAAAERRVAAANAEIGVAKAAYYPDFSISAVLGTEATGAGRLFGDPATVWALGPTGVMTLFDAGRRRAVTDQARALDAEAAASYRQSVLTAYGEVEDNLAASQLLAQEADSQAAAVAAASDARAQAERRYNGGYAAYYEVVTAQNIELSARLQQAQIEIRRVNTGVLLVKALGGGWTATQGL